MSFRRKFKYADDELKRCVKCGDMKINNDFYRSKTAKDGKSAYCIKCMGEYCKAWRLDRKNKQLL